jgi:serine phosphatase RsbU (regulator of sigma subunit)
LAQAAGQTDEELRIAARIQQGLLPTAAPLLTGFEIAAACHPSRATGGDFFDYIPLPDGCWGIAIGDVSSHGFGPALLMAETHAILRTLALVQRDLGEILTMANRLLCNDTADDQFVTVFLGRLDPCTGSFQYASAGHEGYLLDPSGLIAKLCSTGLPLGILDSTSIPMGRSIDLRPGQCLILVTDGLVEAQDDRGRALGIEPLLNAAQAHLHQSAQEIIDALFWEVERFRRSASLNDDLTAVAIKMGTRTGAPSLGLNACAAVSDRANN